MSQCADFPIDVWFGYSNQCMSKVPTEGKSLQRIRTVPNILKRKRSQEMNIPQRSASISNVRNSIEVKKQIFDPIRSELLTWVDRRPPKSVILNTNTDHMYMNREQPSESESDGSQYSPMWCPPNLEPYSREHNVKIIDTVTVNLPIDEMTNSICIEFVQPEFHDFQREMEILIPEDTIHDAETVIELGRFERYANDDDLQTLMQEDPFDEIIIRNSWSKFECLTCGKTYSSQSGLNKHLKTKHHRIISISTKPVIVLTCPGCFRIFKTYLGYDRHVTRCNMMSRLREE